MTSCLTEEIKSLASRILRKVLIVYLEYARGAGSQGNQGQSVNKTRVASSVFSHDYQIVGIN